MDEDEIYTVNALAVGLDAKNDALAALREENARLKERCHELRQKLCDCDFYPDCRPHCRAY